jgi:HPt (histidine-containing phosphotransfer) domain-containing protein
MSIDQVIEAFRPVFRAELPERIERIHAGLQAQSGGRAADALQTAFRESHSLAGTAAYMDAPELTTAAESLSVHVRGLLADVRDYGRKPLGEAWRLYERLRAAAAAYLDVDAVGPERPAADARASDDG